MYVCVVVFFGLFFSLTGYFSYGFLFVFVFVFLRFIPFHSTSSFAAEVKRLSPSLSLFFSLSLFLNDSVRTLLGLLRFATSLL